MRVAVLLALPVLLVLPGCAADEPVPLTFAVTEFEPPADFAPEVTAAVQDDVIAVNGALLGSLCGSAPAAVATSDGAALTLRISFGRRTAVPCPAVARALRYEATLTDMEPGVYELRVVHVTRGLKRNQQPMLTEQVTVR